MRKDPTNGMLYVIISFRWRIVKAFWCKTFSKTMNGFKHIVRIGIVYNKPIAKISIKNDCIYDKMKTKNTFWYKIKPTSSQDQIPH